MINLDKADTGFQYVMQAYRIGGLYMHIITILGLIALGVTVWKVYGMVTKKQVDTKLLGLVKMAGSLAAGVGFLSQIIGIVGALEAIKAAADVSPEIVMNGAIVSFYAPFWGLVVFVFAMIFYYGLREIIKARMD